MDWSHIPVASYVFFGLFVALSLVHLVFCFLEKELARKITKCPGTLCLFVAAVIAVPNEPLVYLGLFFGLLGDFCLLKKHKVWPFICGTVSFLIGHILYIAMFIRLCGELHYAYFVGTGLWVILFPILFVRLAKTIVHQKKLIVIGCIYFSLLTLDLIWAIIACAHGCLDYVLLSAFGAVCFIISDSFLTRTMFKKDVKRRDFYIMSTYLLAQGLIIVGFVMTLLK